MIYKASRDGFSAEKFHELCDGKGVTLVIAVSQAHNRIFGGFTNIPWTQNDGFKVGKASSFVFTFDHKDKLHTFECNDNKLETHHSKDTLVAFGCQMNAIYSPCL